MVLFPCTRMSRSISRRVVRKLRGGHAGQSVVELALIAPLLALLLMVAADLGRVFYLSIAVNNAASAGVHFAAQEGNANDATGMETAACNDFGISPLATCQQTLGMTATSFCECPNGASPGAQVDCTSTCADLRIYAEVTTTTSFSTLLPYPGIPSVSSVNGTAVMRVQ
jgi:Flp pilus assembly protein TadG